MKKTDLEARVKSLEGEMAKLKRRVSELENSGKPKQAAPRRDLGSPIVESELGKILGPGGGGPGGES